MNKNTIEKNRKMCHKILKAMDILEKIYNYEPQNEIDEIFKLYITTEGATNAAKYLNSQGRRIKTKRGTRAYTSTDILMIIRDEDNNRFADQFIMTLARKISENRKQQKWSKTLLENITK